MTATSWCARPQRQLLLGYPAAACPADSVTDCPAAVPPPALQKAYWKEHSTEPTLETMLLDTKARELDQKERPEIMGASAQTQAARGNCEPAPPTRPGLRPPGRTAAPRGEAAAASGRAGCSGASRAGRESPEARNSGG